MIDEQTEQWEQLDASSLEKTEDCNGKNMQKTGMLKIQKWTVWYTATLNGTGSSRWEKVLINQKSV